MALLYIKREDEVSLKDKPKTLSDEIGLFELNKDTIKNSKY